ncbi:MAG: outer membrane protein assembly factor BamD [Candidatus Cloacimonetes bacterium]|jgi:outer membrane protein assembly factor BamD|nr:outer membrane protein assembly factor BamD [Candidatus Cloacimonadota bacterium]MCB5288317.1 outer membrane protein assembly factor BamD [Candidatus Cloacimonadota bacterium]MCK9184643.1 outer membrane protein assembly factor BamD [Candidatus Cloacimonadota bacterium]MCK9583418.1 outer membrane protein assembly factor BamD [Candidatus Cloacimonadota bacterium]MDY0230631.1 outer membrane protein assembly factor BamD [Candidatus Cloacimonadaceae bacterium]
MKRYLSFLLLIILVFGACSKNKVEITTEQKLAMADNYYGNGKYAKAAVLYDEISFERKSAATAYATMRLADSYFAMNKFTDARLKYQQFIDGFPDHSNAADAYFRIALCLFEESAKPSLDQTETVEAIEAFGVFLERFPNDSRYPRALEYVRRAQYKLIEKKYQNGYIYYKMKDYSAALMYFDEVIALGNTDALDRKSLYYSALLHQHQKNHEAANEAFMRLKSRYPGSKEVKKLERRFD